ncbi:uncharacterized protein ciartb [Aplochiton taeniatus]
MSASDSDNSIDWLASDDEDKASEPEPDCAKQRNPPTWSPPPSPGSDTHPGRPGSGRCGSTEDPREGGDHWRGGGERSAHASPSSCTGTSWESDASELCQTAHSQRSKGTKTSEKRPHSPVTAQHKERQLTSSQSEQDRLYTNKCIELQCYIQPLSAILNGLRSGRYRERLSSFQESVAMDRIQRIMGVLKNPSMGEKYVNIILKMEQMLKSWFPNINPQDQRTPTVPQTAETPPSKKRKLSPASGAVSSGPVHGSATGSPGTAAKTPRVTDLSPSAAYSANVLKWLHASPVCSPPAEQAPPGPRAPSTPRDRELTQDSSVSSSTDSRPPTDSAAASGRPPPGKINAPCLERLLKSTESIVTRKGAGGVTGSGCS